MRRANKSKEVEYIEDEKAPPQAGVSDEQIVNAAKAVRAYKEKASSHTGEAGQATKAFVDAGGDGKALTIITSLLKKERDVAQRVIRAIVRYSLVLGIFDQETETIDLEDEIKKRRAKLAN